MTAPSLCFVSPYAHALFTEQRRGFGGAEVQQRLIGLALRERGWDVRFLSYAPGEAREEVHAGIRFRTIPPPGRLGGGPVRKPAVVNLWRALARVNADVYYQRCAGSITGVVAAFARLHGRPFVFSVANDRDLDGRFLREATVYERLLYRLGLRLATRVVVQTDTQSELLREGWGREGTLINSACGLPAGSPPAAAGRTGVLWVGNLLPKKQPQLVPRLAAALPDVPFTMIAPPAGDPAYVREVLEAVARQPNLMQMDRVPHADMPSCYRKAALLVSTSVAEGFANVFLEAWASGMPVVSFGIDPDGIISRHGLGVCTKSIEETAVEVRRLLGSPDEREAIGARARAYVRDNHAPAAIAARYEELLSGLPGVSRTGFGANAGPGP